MHCLKNNDLTVAYLFFLCWLFFGQSSNILHAQNFPLKKQVVDKQWTWGVQMGINKAHISEFTPFPDTLLHFKQARLAATTGLSLSYRFHPSWQFRSEINYSSKGVAFTSKEYWLRKNIVSSGDLAERLRFPFLSNYLEIPLLIQCRLPLAKANIAFETGFAPAYLLSASTITPFLNNQHFIEYKIMEWESPNHWDCGFVLGGQLQFEAEDNHSMHLNIRLIQGFLPILITTDTQQKAFNQTVNIGFGYTF